MGCPEPVQNDAPQNNQVSGCYRKNSGDEPYEEDQQ